MEAIFGIVMLALALLALFAARLLVTSQMMASAANELRRYCEEEIDRLDIPAIKRLWDRLDRFDAILFNPLIWTWRQAFPWLAELRRGQRPPKAPPARRAA